ncbi:SpoIIE family protein phosphatase [Synechococcus sp. CS-602]|uniref:PP2C family protein-serine/threonine phosphatase n=1 Tax=Synechococcaceae TaxID=1890426 RepID=UPI0008FF23DA|nr:MULTISPECIES: GAF domain-containing SpoIIE family protein phosphatase [Synechococcaceae]MCT4364855.1 SpoIIE family protein phosphatase [Candidatus Regnicoccus frigidus MAG-AL1]MCT0203359.1 SpoIIE family protein phosphatase [Synechococcus sp. CS-603]MCT0204007.1 SpoIIE family protein phosphatase [Synechococcus sp. CS-602]MCT0246579.1 SpoIIE family protein phosphatase [Synechococcus sp. CS-601]MCT4368538.1 SpoIIE family protein phosphatase [Candidatus Regnicoccus frigidus MAG-AL2]
MRQLLESLSREQSRNQELLASLGFALRSFTNLNRFLELVPLVSARLVGAEGSLLVPFHADGRLWKEQFQASPPERSHDLLRQLISLADQPRAHHSPANQPPVEGAAEEAVALRLDRDVGMLLGETQVFGTSVVARNHPWGRLYVFGSSQGLSWSDSHRRHIQLVADLTAVAIESEWLQEDSRRHERLDRQLSTGAEIQAQLLPNDCPVIEGIELAAHCRPAFQVGGDYYDFIPTHPQHFGRQRETSPWALVMGDVMGKGVPAGLLMTLLRGMLRAEVLSGLPPDRILHDLNALAQEDLAHSHRFVTLFYSDFDPLTRVLRYANAAHNPPLICRREGYRVERLDAPGLLIGLQLEADYGCQQVVLEPGDVILYYTDGVSEAAGPGGERFDEDRLIQCLQSASRSGLPAQGILDRLFARLDRFVGAGHQLDDDASMVVLKVRDEVRLPFLPG